MANPIERPLYREGQILGADDLAAGVGDLLQHPVDIALGGDADRGLDELLGPAPELGMVGRHTPTSYVTSAAHANHRPVCCAGACGANVSGPLGRCVAWIRP